MLRQYEKLCDEFEELLMVSVFPHHTPHQTVEPIAVIHLVCYSMNKKYMGSVAVDSHSIIFPNKVHEVRGREKEKQIAQALVRKPIENQPDDFQSLFKLIVSRVGAPG